jgi:hypothetical protein
MAALTDLPGPSRPRTADQRLLWFARLEVALSRGDHDSIRNALRHLERLGVEVRFTLPPEQCREANPPTESRPEEVGHAT